MPCLPPLRRVWRALGAIDAEFGAVLAQALLLAFCEAVPARVPIQVPVQVPAPELLSRARPRPAAAAAPTTPLRRAAPASPLADAHIAKAHTAAHANAHTAARPLVGLARAALVALLRCGVLSVAQLEEQLAAAEGMAREVHGDAVAAAVRTLASHGAWVPGVRL